MEKLQGGNILVVADLFQRRALWMNCFERGDIDHECFFLTCYLDLAFRTITS